MSLGDVVLVLGGLLALTALPTLALAEARTSPAARPPSDLPFVLLCGGLTLTFATLIAIRAAVFGVDSAAYAQLFRAYCAGQSMDADGNGYALSMRLLNLAMGGACEVRYLPVAWMGIMLGGTLLLPVRLSERVVYLAVLLFSMIGVELTTNALRQGFSVALLVPSVGFFQRRRFVVAGALLVAAGLLHESALLAGAAFVATVAPWRLFIPGFVIACLGAAASLRMDLPTGLVGELVYEIQKYQGHESDELWVRIIAAAHLLATVALTRRLRLSGHATDSAAHDSDWERILKLTVTAALFIWLPYFGYRYIYATYPVVLWLALGLLGGQPGQRRKQVLGLLAAHTVLLLVWSLGSSYMRHVPFLTESALR